MECARLVLCIITFGNLTTLCQRLQRQIHHNGKAMYNCKTVQFEYGTCSIQEFILVVRVASLRIDQFVRDRTFDEHVDGTNILRTSNAVRTVLDCSRICGDDDDCVAFYFTPDTQQCQEQVIRSNGMVGLTPKPGARYYYIPVVATVAPTATPTTAAVLTTATTSALPIGPVCPVHNAGWVASRLPDGTVAQYLLDNTVVFNHPEADAYCQNIGGHLPKFVTAQKMDFYLNSIVPCSDVNGYKFWVDGTNTPSNYDYITYDGEVVPRIPELWASQRPNSEHDQNCIQSRLSTFDYKFDDYYCNNAEHQILCEKIIA